MNANPQTIPQALPQTLAASLAPARDDVWLAVRRGVAHRCPNCGKGHLFRAYLKQVDACAECRESFRTIRADDGPTWLTVLIVGHVVVALALLGERFGQMPMAWSVAFFTSLSFVMCLAVLPRAKGAFIAAIWSMRVPDSGAD
jgi:uncharacterized protein (DUF983 family)